MIYKLFFSAFLINILSFAKVSAQWNIEFQVNNFDANRVASWMPFKKLGDKWEYRFYVLDTTKFEVYSSQYGGSVQYSYNFSSEERAAGNLLYSVGEDLTGDNIVEFYVLAYYGTTDIRQSVKILNIASKATLFSLNDPNYSFSAPTIYDIDNDGILEAVYARYAYPYTGVYGYVVYNTGVSASIGSSIENLKFDLKQNYPNPFNPSTVISYQLSAVSYVTLKVYDILGREVVSLVNNEVQTAGVHKYFFNASGLSSGIYLYKITADGFTSSKKMLLIK